MKDFHEWMFETGKGQQLDEFTGILKNLSDRNVTGGFGNAIKHFDKRTDNASIANRNAGIVQTIMKHAQMLPKNVRKNLGRQLAMGGFGIGDNRATNPKARYGSQATQGE